MPDPLRTYWDRLREPLVEAWPGLTEHDLDTIDGSRDALIDLLEARYGTERDRLVWLLDELIGRYGSSDALRDSPTAHHQWWDATLDVYEPEDDL